jgi:N-carbamoylputrescine amidase
MSAMPDQSPEPPPPAVLSVGAVQAASENSQIEANLARALPLVEDGARQGAKLILLPEFLPTGYIYAPAIWDAAEPREGPTVKWLKYHARRLSIYLGTSYLEADGDDFYNTFVLATPEGTEAGRVRKETPAAFEAFFTLGEASPHVIETEIGRIGVSICYENQLAYASRLMFVHSVDLMLMPHSAPVPGASILIPDRHIEQHLSRLRDLASTYASMLGIPVLKVNKCGPWESPLPGLPFLPQRSYFPGLSTIADSDGTVRAQLGEATGVIVEDVTLDPARKVAELPYTRGRWFGPAPWPTRAFVISEAVGALWYKLSAERRRRARAVSST